MRRNWWRDTDYGNRAPSNVIKILLDNYFGASDENHG